MAKCDFNKVAKQLYWNRTFIWTPLGGCFWGLQHKCFVAFSWFFSERTFIKRPHKKWSFPSKISSITSFFVQWKTATGLYHCFRKFKSRNHNITYVISKSLAIKLSYKHLIMLKTVFKNLWRLLPSSHLLVEGQSWKH